MSVTSLARRTPPPITKPVLVASHPPRPGALTGPTPVAVYIAKLSPGSRPTMLCALNCIARFFGTTRLALPWHLLRYEHTQALRAWLLEAYAPASANRHLAALRGVLRCALRLELLDDATYRRTVDLEPIRGARLLRGREITSGELRALFVACRALKPLLGARNAALLGLLYGGGLRRAEAVAVNVEDLVGNALRVRGKGQKDRRVFLPSGAVRAIEAWLELRGRAPGPMLLAITKRGDIDSPRRGLCTESVLATLERLAATAGVAHFSPHDFRRTYVGDMLEAGVDLKTVQDLVGHAQPTTTARYDRRGDRAKARAADAISVPYG